MKYPQEVKDNNKIYCFIKEYPNFALYESKNGFRRCYDKFDLRLLKNSYKERGPKKTSIIW